MKSLEDRLRRLRENKQPDQEQRRKVWEVIKKEYPDHARLLSDVADIFGKPAKVIMIDIVTNERIL